MKITQKDFADYVCGWLESCEANNDDLSIGNMWAALKNAAKMLEDHQDGIESYLERKAANNKAK